jgi:mycothiol synthase
MKPILRSYRDEEDYWRIRQFLREVFILNDRREHSWHVSRWDYLQWHMITTCQICPPLKEVTTIWENPVGQIAAVMNPLDPDEAFLHIHPAYRTPELEQEMIAHAEQTFSNIQADGMRRLYIPVDEDDQFRKDILQGRGYAGIGNLGFEHYRDLDAPIPEPRIPPGYAIRSMGGVDEHPARSWASWQAFHPEEPDDDYDPDASWYKNIQRGPLYRRDLDIVAATQGGEIAAFCTIYYDDSTRSAVTDLVGTATPHQQRGLGKAVIFEGMRRLQRMGCTRVFAKATDAVADALYNSVMPVRLISETWIKDYTI